MPSLSFISLNLLFLTSHLYFARCYPVSKRSTNGPVISTNFQDPSIIQVGETWYGFAGANGNPTGINVQVATSADFETWTLAEGYDALPVLGAWAGNPGHVWAPDVAQLVRLSSGHMSNLLTE